VKNYTLRDALYRLRARVGVTYGSDVRQVRQVLEQTAAAITFRDLEKEPRILLLGFGNSSVDFEVSVWIEDPWHSQRALSELNEAIWWALKGAGITIAFPQLDLHLDGPVEDSLRRLSTV
jgi:potassium-dependent mechanosensitive channel